MKKDEAKVKKKALRSKGRLKNRRGEGRNDLPAPSERAERLKHEGRIVFCRTTPIAVAISCDSKLRCYVSSIVVNRRSAPQRHDSGAIAHY